MLEQEEVNTFLKDMIGYNNCTNEECEVKNKSEYKRVEYIHLKNQVCEENEHVGTGYDDDKIEYKIED